MSVWWLHHQWNLFILASFHFRSNTCFFLQSLLCTFLCGIIFFSFPSWYGVQTWGNLHLEYGLCFFWTYLDRNWQTEAGFQHENQALNGFLPRTIDLPSGFLWHDVDPQWGSWGGMDCQVMKWCRCAQGGCTGKSILCNFWKRAGCSWGQAARRT